MAQVSSSGRILFTKVDERGRLRLGRLLEDGADAYAAAGGGSLLAAEASLLATLVYFRPAPDTGAFRGEIGLLGQVSPATGRLGAEAALLGTNDLTAPPPAGRLIRSVRGAPVTWEAP